MQQNNQAIQAYLSEQIPLSRAMQVRILEVQDNYVILAAPLLPNINHRSTAFGGSAVTLAILSAWTLINFRLQKEGFNSRLVIQKNTMNYKKPITKNFEAVCVFDKPDTWARFIKTLQCRRKARIVVDSVLKCDRQDAGRFSGVYVALEV